MTTPASPFAKQLSVAGSQGMAESLRAVARHSLPALQRLYEPLAPGMLAQLLQMLGDRRLAEAALVDCWVEVWEQATTFNPARSTASVWVNAIARHHAIAILRVSPMLAPAEDVDSGVQLLQATLEERGFSPDERMLRLVWCSGRAPLEIARALQLPFSQVQRQIRNGLAALCEARVEPASGQLGIAGRRQPLLEQLAGAYALGSLTLRASRRFEALMAYDIAARRAWQRWEERLAAFTLDIPAVRPPDHAWARIAQRIAPQPRAWSPLRWLMAAFRPGRSRRSPR